MGYGECEGVHVERMRILGTHKGSDSISAPVALVVLGARIAVII